MERPHNDRYMSLCDIASTIEASDENLSCLSKIASWSTLNFDKFDDIYRWTLGGQQQIKVRLGFCLMLQRY